MAGFDNAPASFYADANLLFIPSARYPESQLKRPLFGVSYNSKLRSPKSANHNVRLANLVDLNRTVLFQESGYKTLALAIVQERQLLQKVT